ncbi:MAG TPA: hypothetical protein VFT59_04260 [Candidatus Saccharimonadales bacterium]|nr:hypothetical protein [Candidatus Saccharimonadales bacterium]
MTTLERIPSPLDAEDQPNPPPEHEDSGSASAHEQSHLPEVVPPSVTVLTRRLGSLGLNRILPRKFKKRSGHDTGRLLETKEVILKQGEWVKDAPDFLEQCDDTTRTNIITYNSNLTHALPSGRTGESSYEQRSLTAHESLVGLRNFLKTAVEEDNKYKDIAISMLETITFIDKKEYDEAARCFAQDWRRRLNENPRAQLCILLTEMKNSSVIKSGEYLFDNVLKNFTDSELKQFRGRLVGSPDDLTASPEDVSIILLDDWTISGKQLQEAGHELAIEHPEYRERLEVQLIAATEEMIKDGLSVLISNNSHPGELEYEYQTTPISAYYRAHDDPLHAPHSGAHISGAHCSVDYDFNTSIETIAIFSNNKIMPPLTNIVRPYRQKGYEPTRIKKLLGRGWKRKTASHIR